MKKYLAEGLVIFASIFASFSVENIRQDSIEKDIIKALDKGLLSGAFLDVFEEEPLPENSPLWLHPKVKLTPHIASLTYPKESISSPTN